MSQALTFTILAAAAGVMAVLPVVYFEYRRTRRREDGRWFLSPGLTLSGGDRGADSPEVLMLTSFPPEDEGLMSVVALQRLSPCAVANLAALGYDEIQALTNDLPVGLPIAPHHGPSFTEDELAAQGYVATVDSPFPDDDRQWAILTDQGRQLARLLTASSESPQWLWDASQVARG